MLIQPWFTRYLYKYIVKEIHKQTKTTKNGEKT